ncbi:FKBP-type peptidyl-prolyl cis-trans isomerase [Streptomyces sp. XD-27]|uniref:FKBP-type peptidyl-prolyl cis-trans isomerase n=1 Tax=Streptomyces sp. XD-27 TaxID=3062779 RepID=UPI0026F466C8|nr:FKBP-type peptidyl-prolyl cis-trans isomerase [Streptomyces sp. XD-27]WKX69435.1 FKBP-type peptidyl-prolyl cis-trans isomerase [Streptomyces sp. XD-27]
MRRRSVLLAVPAGLLALAGCGDDDSDKGEKTSPKPESPSAQPTAKMDGPVPALLGGTKFGERPEVARGVGKGPGKLETKTLVAGRGPVAAKGDYIQVNYLGQIWDTGKVFDTTWDKGRNPFVFRVGAGEVVPGWDKGLEGKKVGSRVELAIPPELGYGPQGRPPVIKGTDIMVFVVDVVGVFNSKSSAHGSKVAQDNKDLPKVGDDTDGKAPAITVPKTKAPKKLVSAYVLEGDGREVKETDTVLLQYRGVLWDGGKEFDSTYASKALAKFNLPELVPGFRDGLKGKKIGSRVLLVMPPELAYGKEARDKIPANSTLVFSVDILAVS